MLSLIGMGLWTIGDLPLRAAWELRKCDEVYAEQYTSAMQAGLLSQLQGKIGKSRIRVLSRAEVEKGEVLLKAAEKKRVALLIPGDPLIATTHISLLLEAKKRGIKTQIIHASSIFTAAIGEAGLQVYKFGRTVTLAKWQPAYEPMSAYDYLGENLARKLHTLLLIDIDEGRPLSQAEIFDLLAKMEKRGGKGIFAPKRELVVLSAVGSANQRVSYGPIEKLEKAKLGKPPFTIIVPGELHFMEKEALEAFSN
ncbi:Diphthine synthase [Candidatus Burarchaeum australiense]|nr:Diphthine synthase [Candidatus Burarchaeum australiense]